jgi:hypothetical protein
MGTPVEQMPPPPATKTNVLTIVSLVGGILGLLGMCISVFASLIPVFGSICLGLSGILAVIALITGFLGMGQANKNAEKGRGMAVTGIILSVIALLGVCLLGIVQIFASSFLGTILSQISSGMMNSGLFVPTP